MITFVRLLLWGIMWLPAWIITIAVRSIYRKPKVDNCLSWSIRKWDTHGGYLVIRWCQSNKLKFLRWPHFMWLPAQYHQELRHYIPKSEDSNKHMFPAPFFEGKIQRGDDDTGVEN